MCRKLINLYMYFSSRPDNGYGGEDEESITLSLDKRKSTVQEGTNQLADVGGISYSKYLQGRNMSFAFNAFPFPPCACRFKYNYSKSKSGVQDDGVR